MKCRDFRRRPEGDKWSKETLDEIKGTPWQPTPGRESVEIKCRINMPQDETPVTQPVTRGDEEGGVKRAKIFKDDLVRFGHTVGCQGYKAAVRGRTAQSHSEECRKRIEDELRKENSKRVSDADDRMRRKKKPEEDKDETNQDTGGTQRGREEEQEEGRENKRMKQGEE